MIFLATYLEKYVFDSIENKNKVYDNFKIFIQKKNNFKILKYN